MGELVEMGAIRGPKPEVCECGSWWWKAVVQIEGGRIVGWGTAVVCSDCGRERIISKAGA